MNRGLIASVLAGVVAGAVVAALIQLRADESAASRSGPWAHLGDADPSAAESRESALTALGPFSSLVAEYDAIAELADADVLASRFALSTREL